MRKDIFIDNCIAINFLANPLDPEYKKLIEWLKMYDSENKDKNAYLMVSDNLIKEYTATAGSSASKNNICNIIPEMQKKGRLVRIKKEQIKEFNRVYFTKGIEKRHKGNETSNKQIREFECKHLTEAANKKLTCKVKIRKKQIREIKHEYVREGIERRLECNEEDWDHIPMVLLSERKYALSLDENFIKDLHKFSGFVVVAAKKPQDIPYDK